MPNIREDEIRAARQIDLLSYLLTYEPEELVKLPGNNYCTREHDSLKISNGKWYWFSRGIGGKTALDYLVKVKGLSFPDAVRLLTGTPIQTYVPPRAQAAPKERTLLLPEVDRNRGKVRRYLRGRGIHPAIIDYCFENKLLFQTAKYKNVLFVGYDNSGKPRYGAIRSTSGAYKLEAPGSDKRYAFSITNAEEDSLHVFESAIDLLSFATLRLYEGKDWKRMSMLSLAGVFAPKRPGVVPAALSRFLSENPRIKTLRLHLDNDEVGRAAAAGIAEGLGDYTVVDEPPACGKDVNEELQIKLGLMGGVSGG